MDLRSAAIVDFESFPIGPRPGGYPPEPVGVALDVPGRKPRYLAWGHPGGGNGCSWADARAALGAVWESGRPVAFHNAPFDLSVVMRRLDLPPLPWDRVHDTKVLLFLDEPRAATFALKPSAERVLGEAPTERDALIDWLMEHQPVPGVRLSRSTSSDSYAGAFVAYAPPSVAGPYAIGDVRRTRSLLNVVGKRVEQRGMWAAYQRELKLIPITMELEEQGLRVGLERLRTDVKYYTDTAARLDEWLRKRLKAPSDVNLNSTEQLVAALISGRAVDRTKLGVTKTGKQQTNKEALERAITDKQVAAALVYRAKLKTDLGTFMRPWLEVAERTGGFIFTSWYSTRSDENGTKTGRFSSTPNFQNLPKEVEPLFRHEARRDHPEDRDLPSAPVRLPSLPLIRSYVVPYAEDDVLIDRDYSQQELRILGHFEGNALLKAYQANPWMDIHEHTQKMVNELLSMNLPRKPIKNTNFGIVYGLGVEKLARKSKCTVELADKIRRAVRQLYPGLREMNQEMKRRAAAHEPIRTWGGREYYCEEPRVVDGKHRTFEYRLVNILIQGSAADCTKEALIRYWAAKPRYHRVLTIPHDELLVSVPREERDAAMETLREAMESVEFDVAMLSEGKWSDASWAALQPYDKAGKRVVTP